MLSFLLFLIAIAGVLSTLDSNGKQVDESIFIQDETQKLKHEENAEDGLSREYFNRDSTFDALAVIKKRHPKIPHQIRLPHKAKESESGEIQYLNPTIQYLCPDDDYADTRNVMASKHNFPNVEYCLMDHFWGEHPSKCHYEVRPFFGLVKLFREFETSCGKLYENRRLHAFGFMYCTFTDRGIHQPPHIKASQLGIYEICLDTYYSKTMWTKHVVQSGFMLKDSGLPSQQTEYPSKFRTYSYDLPEKTFLDIEAEYEKQKETTPRYNMIPQMLVPQEDLALKMWKKTTDHYLNTAPLWDELVPLMNAINDGIRKVGITIDLRNYEKKVKEKKVTDQEIEDEESDESEEEIESKELKESKDEKDEKEKKEERNENEEVEEEETYEEEIDTHTLFIYTTTLSHLFQWQRFFKMINIFKNKDPFGWNIWCKFIYYSHKHEGLMIYLHNLPDNPPEKLNPMEDDPKPNDLLKGKECAEPVPCDIRIWANEPGSISDYLLKYAYCCRAEKKKIDELFSISFTEEINLLNIDEIVKENKFKNEHTNYEYLHSSSTVD